MVMTQKRQLKMHPKLLVDVIKKQAGTLQKAILEGVMNAIEAGATEVKIDFKELDKVGTDRRSKATLTISDDGEGINSIEEIDEYFETFGSPHKESEHKTWAQFRMGRGQMFSFGKNIWRTSEFKMIVDLHEMAEGNSHDLPYDLENGHSKIKGCKIKIELYHNPIGDWDNRSIDAFKENIEKQIRFMEVPILFNGEQLNTPASECEWDKEDDDAYYLFNVGQGVRIYNMGAYAKEESAYRVGCTGVVVSKKRLDINFARNDIMASCPVYQSIQEVLKENRKKKTRKARTRLFTEAERVATLIDLRDGEQEYRDIKSIKLLPTSNHRLVSLEQIRKCGMPWTFAKDGDRVADRAMQYDQTLCLSDRLPSLLNYAGELKGLFSWLCRDIIRNSSNTVKKTWDIVESFHIPAIKLREGVSEIYKNVPTKKQTKVEKRILKILNDLGCWEGRTIRLGQSDIARAWTDGSSYIVLDNGFLSKCYLAYYSHVLNLFALLCHELAHDISTAGTHVHGQQFYERFHEIVMKKNSPMCYGGDIPNKMRAAMRKEREQAEINKQTKTEEKIRTKLGIK